MTISTTTKILPTESLPSEALPSERSSALAERRLAIGFLNWAHALDHYVILIYPTVVIELEGGLWPDPIRR